MFYRLSYPDYATDRMFSRQNPIEYIANDYAIPGMKCPVCDTWGVGPSGRIRAHIQENTEITQILRKPYYWIPPDEWAQTSQLIAEQLGVDVSEIEPAAEVGPLRIALKSVPKYDFIFTAYNNILVNDRVRDKLIAINATGVVFNRAELQWAKKKSIDMSAPLPSLWEVEVVGRAVLKLEWLENIASYCPICGRLKGIDYHRLSPDMFIWDGTDFFVLDLNVGIVYVTGRVCHALQDIQATNYQCYPFSLY